MDFCCSFFIKNGPFVRCRETADTAQRDAVLCTAKTRKEGIYDEHFHLPPSVPEGQRPGSAGACAAGLLTGCGGSSSGSASGAASSGSGSSYTILYDSQPATLNYLTTGTDLEMVVGANCVDTLVEYDNKGVMREGLATSWDWDVDTLTWTFHLREENWVDCNGEVVAPVTAQDFVDALKYVLTPDYAASNVGLVTAYIAGADDYYNYHLYLNNANTGVVDDDGTTYTVDGSGVVTVTAPDSDPATYAPVDFDAVGVTAVDDHTLTYTLTYDFPGFLSLLCYLL